MIIKTKSESDIKVEYIYNSVNKLYYAIYEPTLYNLLIKNFHVVISSDGTLIIAYADINNHTIVEHINSLTVLTIKLTHILNNTYLIFLEEFIKCVKYEFEDYIHIKNRFQKAKE